MNRRLIATSAACGLATAGIALAVQVPGASAREDNLRATLRDASGAVVGKVSITLDQSGTAVKVELVPNANVTPAAFHGLHVHANLDPANGSGCIADPAQPTNTWFTSADGHLSLPGQTHGLHAGDLPSPLVMANGRAALRFTTERANPADLIGRAVILHARPDNFGNVPVGTADNQYTPNQPAATDLTTRTGNAGDRVACGVIKEG